MKIFKKLMTALLIVAFALPAFAATNLLPSKNHSGFLGKSGKAWYATYSDYYYMTGGTAFKFQFTGTPTANRTITIPDASGTLVLNGTASHDYAGAAEAWTMTAAEAQASFVTVTNANGAIDAVLPAAIPGKVWVVYNNSGQTLTFKVTGQAGATLATGKYGVYVGTAADLHEIYEQN